MLCACSGTEPIWPVPPQFDANSGGGHAGSGLYPGSTRVFGMGKPNAVPGNSCIAIYAVGPNGRLDNPPGSGDDQLLGTGGVNASGLFVDAMGNPGIPVAPPLRLGERLFAVDVCQGLVGPVAIISNRTLAPIASHQRQPPSAASGIRKFHIGACGPIVFVELNGAGAV